MFIKHRSSQNYCKLERLKKCQYYYCSYDCRNLVQNKIATLVDILKVLTY